jgi:hypothetical protein
MFIRGVGLLFFRLWVSREGFVGLWYGLFNMVFECFSTKNALTQLVFSSASIVVSVCAVLSVGFVVPFCQFA